MLRDSAKIVHTMVVRFIVAGHAKPKGSMKAFIPKGWNRPVLTSTNASVKTWEQTIRNVAQDHANAFTTDPVRVRLRLSLPRPKSLSRQASRTHTKRPDVDKLARACLDALTGILWSDDSQVTSLNASKQYAAIDEAPHLTVTVLST